MIDGHVAVFFLWNVDGSVILRYIQDLHPHFSSKNSLFATSLQAALWIQCFLLHAVFLHFVNAYWNFLVSSLRYISTISKLCVFDKCFALSIDFVVCTLCVWHSSSQPPAPSVFLALYLQLRLPHNAPSEARILSLSRINHVLSSRNVNIPNPTSTPNPPIA